MHKRLKTIHKYYNNLEYNKISKKIALKYIATLNKKIQFKNMNCASDRIFLIITLMKENLSIFQSACEHVDVVANILQLLNEMDITLKHAKDFNLEIDIIYYCFCTKIILLFSMWKEDEVQLFLQDIILIGTKFNTSSFCNNLQNIKTFIAESCNEMILLQDSDLYAVISYLIITRKFSLNKIWVHEQIQEKFLSLLKKNFHHSDFPIHVFRFKEDFLTTRTNNFNLNITSIWSEDIVTAKNLALSLHKEIVYINVHMDIFSLSYMPHMQVYEKIVRDRLSDVHFRCLKGNKMNVQTYSVLERKQNESVNDNVYNYTVYNPFYDGVWKLINMHTIHKGSTWACITFNDIKNCINSANKGFETWNTMSFNSRIQVLSHFAFTLECHGKFLLANVISRLIEGSYLIKNSSICYEMGGFEVTVQNKPVGIIFLKEENEITLFSRLIQILLAGNSVIVLCDANSCNLASYCNMFATAEIPPGVINMLPSESLENLEAVLFNNMTYAEYIALFFGKKNRSNDVLHNFTMLQRLSIVKQIVCSCY